MTDPRRALPSVHTLLDSEAVRPLLERAPRALVADAVRDAVEHARRDPDRAPRDPASWRAAVDAALDERERRSLRRVLNATGVVLHTNLGRAPLLAMMSGTRKLPPISTSSPRDTIASAPSANVLSASTIALAPLFTTSASSAPVSSRNNPTQCT